MEGFLPFTYQRLAIVGLAKNVGKTTTLNWLVEEGDRQGHQLGLASTGVDGEKQDVWDLHQKPAINIKRGMWAATAKAALQQSTAHVRIVEELKSSSPMGPVYLVECIHDGQIKLAGTHMNQDVRQAIERFTQHGVTLSFIDGAYDRLASAQEELADAFILCTGAALDADLETAKRRTEEVLLRWDLPLWTELQSVTEQKVGYLQEGKWNSLETPSLLASLEELRLKVAEGISCLSIPGALTEWVMQHFIHTRKPFAWIIEDPTKIFLTRNTIQRWFRMGGEIYLRRKSKLIALSVNPFSPQGEQESERWLHGMKEIAGEILVIDAKRRHII
ncbi:hypothetical protein [Caldalkalibacillus mannanilyticus]|uniref:lysine 5,6-aminomutase reactivase subunit KamB n=1 Tax=Caldalkalibacillus mannanilyticus TaxID=1418 RepID=UPI000469DDBF|nr:hypothetical protein [Caldalkalibacillus mannanilyticus]